MKTFEVQSIAIVADYERVFSYVADPTNLPLWTSAFKQVSDGRALMETPAGSLEVALAVEASRPSGTIDWRMTFPDGAIAKAYSRVLEDGDRCIYSFVLTAPPVPLEQLEGAIDQQSRILQEELAHLRALLER